MDYRPGDRSAACGGQMEPIAVWVRRGGEWAIVHRCRECGTLRDNRIAGDDNEFALLSLAVRPLAQPPFPLPDVTFRSDEPEAVGRHQSTLAPRKRPDQEDATAPSSVAEP